MRETPIRVPGSAHSLRTYLRHTVFSAVSARSPKVPGSFDALLGLTYPAYCLEYPVAASQTGEQPDQGG